MPADVSIRTGFIVIIENNRIKTTKQIDLIVYDNSYPILFKEGDFVILTPEPIRGIIEVKTKIKSSGKNSIREILMESYKNASMILKAKQSENVSDHFFNGVFSFDSDVGHRAALNTYKKHLSQTFEDRSSSESELLRVKSHVNNMCLDQNIFMRAEYHRFAAYRLNQLAHSYFISNLLVYLKFKKMGDPNSWFAFSDKSSREIGSINTINP